MNEKNKFYWRQLPNADGYLFLLEFRWYKLETEFYELFSTKSDILGKIKENDDFSYQYVTSTFSSAKSEIIETIFDTKTVGKKRELDIKFIFPELGKMDKSTCQSYEERRSWTSSNIGEILANYEFYKPFIEKVLIKTQSKYYKDLLEQNANRRAFIKIESQEGEV